jgi:hypothetical protein
MSLPAFRRCNFYARLMLLLPFTIFGIATALIFNTAAIPDIGFARKAFLSSRSSAGHVLP